MGRQLVILLDGTGNRFSHLPTNIVRLRRSLSTDPNQVLAYYDQGVGTFGIKETLFEWQKLPFRICGLAFGWGLKRTIEYANRFLAENYADGDEIFIFGFSRGAYAARALAALLHAVGLVSKQETHLFDYGWSILLARGGHRDKPNFKLQAQFKAAFGKPVKVRFLGLFDTVKSVGWIYDPVIIPYTSNNPIVQTVRHAVSIDERRCFFRQHLWSRTPSSKTDVQQVWFAGVHSDVGGGYPPQHSQLALLSFRWMLGEAIAVGLKIDPQHAFKQLGPAKGVAPGPDADMHDSMTGPWMWAEWVPRRAWSGVDGRRLWYIGAMPPLGRPRPREIEEGELVHASVETRLSMREDYRPVNLPSIRRPVYDHPSIQGWTSACARPAEINAASAQPVGRVA